MRRAVVLGAVAAFALVIDDAGARALAADAALEFDVTDVIALDPDAWLLTYQDLDGDHRPDLAVLDATRERVRIFERRGRTLALVATLASPSPLNLVAVVASSDGDRYPEILIRDDRSGDLVLIEARGDDELALRRFEIGPVREGICLADSDGDGRREIIAAQTSFPSRLHRFEAVGDNRYDRLPPLEGPGGEVYVACPVAGHTGGDLRLAWADTHFWYKVERWQWLETDGRTGAASNLAALPLAIADTNGDGRSEVIASGRAGELVILERGGGGRLVEVLRESAAGCGGRIAYEVPGRTALLCRGTGGEPALRVREGKALVTLWDGADVAWRGAGRASQVLSVSDQNGDGLPELLVVRRGATHLLHVLESAGAN